MLAAFPPAPPEQAWLHDAWAVQGVRPRWLHDGDLPWLRDLYASTREDEMAPVPWSPAQKRIFLDQQFDAQHRHYLQAYADADFLAICEGDDPLGRFYLRRGAPHHLLVDISLFPAARGRGIGAGLIRAAQQQAAAHGCGMTLSVLQQNSAARRLYARLGFVADGEPAPYLRMAWRAAPGATVS